MIKLVEIFTNGTHNGQGLTRYFLREIFVNPVNISYFIEDNNMKRKLVDGLVDLDIDTRQTFTKLSLRTGKEITIVGPPSTISERLGGSSNLLKG